MKIKMYFHGKIKDKEILMKRTKKHSHKTKKIIGIVSLMILVMTITFCFSGCLGKGRLREKLRSRNQIEQNEATGNMDFACDNFIPGIINGYGSGGPYGMSVQTMNNPLWKGKPISVFFPKGVSGKRPVIFFSHAYGASDWKRAYTPFLQHITSLGYITVYSPYQTLRADFDQRYATLWKGFELAVQKFGNQMDLTRVGFVGHSFGGGATPAMAYKGLVDMKWGKRGAFVFILAPWYSFQITPEKLREFPGHVVLLMQIYDRDDTNDHRMAIDIYHNFQLPDSQKHFQVVRSESINGCEIVADHITPGRNPSLRLKQYAVFMPFDAVSDYVFNGNPRGNQVISNRMPSVKSSVYHPLFTEKNPKPMLPETKYKFPWSNKDNQRRLLKTWK